VASVRPTIQRIGGLTFYATRDAFDADNPGLLFEDFEDVHVTIVSCWSFSPVDENTDDECYDPGTLVAPLGLAAKGPFQHVEDALIALSAGYFGQPSTVAGANLETDTTEVWFDPGVNAVGMDVYAFFGNPGITVDVYDTDGALLGSTTVPGDTLGVFLGVRSDEALIGAVRLDADEDYTMVDDVAYGATSVGVESPPESIPFELSVYPNPTTGSGTAALTLSRPMHAVLSVHDALGREVAVLLDGELTAGRHEVRFDGASLPPGSYLLKQEAEGHGRTRRVARSR